MIAKYIKAIQKADIEVMDKNGKIGRLPAGREITEKSAWAGGTEKTLKIPGVFCE